MKPNLKASDEVLISITNECRARIYLYNHDTGMQYLSEIFDYSYVSMFALSEAGRVQSESRNYQDIYKRSLRAEFGY
ncbi:MAG: hypothetical protein ACTHJN_13735 [Ginsengibacter sp.]